MQQADWKRARKQELKNEPYDPEKVWNIEGPERASIEKEARTSMYQNNKHVNLDLEKTFYKRKEDAKDLELTEGRQLVNADNADNMRDKQVLEFKR